MKPTLTIAILTVFATVGFAIELVTTPPTATNSSACSACREATCSAAESSCQDCSTTDAQQQTIAEFLTGSDCRKSCDEGRAAELKAAGLDPYRIEPTDVLTISVPIPHPERDNVRREIRAAVNPDGSIAVPGIGDVRVSDMTPKEAECEIIKRILKSNPEASQTVFSVSVDVAAKNSKSAYVVLQGGARGDNVWQIPATADTTVGSALRKSAWPHPIDFASAKMWVARPCTTSESCETSLPITWNSQTGQPTDATDHALLPGDRLFVQLPTKSAPPTPTSAHSPSVPLLPEPLPPITATAIPSDLPPISIVASAPLAAQQHYLTITSQAPGAPVETRYSAVPAAVPSPYAPKPSPYGPSPLIATQSYSVAAPLASSAPVLPRPVAGPYSDPDAWAHDGQRVEFAIMVVEDVSGSFSEFPKLRDGILMVSDSDATLGALRIMEKQKLVKRISAPRITCSIDEQATLCVATAGAAGDAEEAADSLSVNVKARNAGKGAERPNMQVETSVRADRNRRVQQLQIGYLIEEGQSAIIRSRHPSQLPYQASDEHPVYIVVTPKLVK